DLKGYIDDCLDYSDYKPNDPEVASQSTFHLILLKLELKGQFRLELVGIRTDQDIGDLAKGSRGYRP
ncbi:MAG: hypothetical protein R6V15_14135, partial [Desulfotignum sp.]